MHRLSERDEAILAFEKSWWRFEGAKQHAIRERFGPMRLTLLPVGAYEPRWFMSPVHTDPAEAVAAARLLDAETSVGIHFGTFPQADDGMDEPLVDLEAALSRLRDSGEAPPRFLALPNGGALELPGPP